MAAGGALLLVLCLSLAAAAERPAAPFLRIGVGGRAAGLGEAHAAAVRDVTALYWNPGALAFLPRQQFVFMHNDWFADVKYEYLGYAHPTARYGTIGGSLTFVDQGELYRATYSNPYGTGLGSFSAEDYAFSLSWAQQRGTGLGLGGTVKVIRQQIDNVGATSLAADFGVQYRDWYPGLTLGASLANLGTSARFDARKEQLPLLLRAGAAYVLPRLPLIVTGDVVLLRGSQTSYHAGIEYTVAEMVALRAGYNSGNDAGDGFGGGFGISIDDLTVNYAYVPYGDLGGTHRIDSVFTFGKSVADAGRAQVLPSVPAGLPAPATAPAPAPAPLPRPQPPATLPETRTTASAPRIIVPVASTPQEVSAPPMPPATSSAAAVASLLQAGDDLLARQPAAAAQRYADALQLDPRNYYAYYKIGLAAAALRELQAARAAFGNALVLRPDSVEALVNLGAIEYWLRDRAAAAACWEKALQLQPENSVARHNLERLRRDQ